MTNTITYADTLSGAKRTLVKQPDGSYAERMVIVNEDGSPIGGGSATTTTDRELIVSTYRCKTAFVGASVGDTITATQVIDVSGAAAATVGTIWRNQTTAADLAGAPAAATLELVGSQALTSAQLVAAGLALEATQQSILNLLTAGISVSGPLTAAQIELGSGASTAKTQRVTVATDGPVGGKTDAAAAADGTGDYSLISAIKRGLLNWAALLARVPSPTTPGLLPVDTVGTPGVARAQATGTAAANIVLTATCRRVSMYATQGAWFSIAGAATTASHYIGANERLDFNVPAGTTIGVLQDAAAGSVRVMEIV